MDTVTISAVTATLLLIALGAFQLALIFGVPIGRFAWGGQHDVLPRRLRIGSAISILLYGLFAVVILSSAGAMPPIAHETVLSVAMWVLCGYFALGIFMNLISRSKPERALMTPVALCLAVLFFVVAFLG